MSSSSSKNRTRGHPLAQEPMNSPSNPHSSAQSSYSSSYPQISNHNNNNNINHHNNSGHSYLPSIHSTPSNVRLMPSREILPELPRPVPSRPAKAQRSTSRLNLSNPPEIVAPSVNDNLAYMNGNSSSAMNVPYAEPVSAAVRPPRSNMSNDDSEASIMTTTVRSKTLPSSLPEPFVSARGKRVVTEHTPPQQSSVTKRSNPLSSSSLRRVLNRVRSLGRSNSKSETTNLVDNSKHKRQRTESEESSDSEPYFSDSTASSSGGWSSSHKMRRRGGRRKSTWLPKKNNLDLLSTLRNIRSDSRYAFTSPSSDAILSYVDSQRGQGKGFLHTLSGKSSMLSLDQSSSRNSSTASLLPHGSQSPNGSSTSLLDSSNVTNRQYGAGREELKGDTSGASSSPGSVGQFDDQASTLGSDNGLPLYDAGGASVSTADLAQIFEQLRAMFGFQLDSMRNMYDAMRAMLESRSSNMSPTKALLSLHADYIGGENANYKKWYLSEKLKHAPVTSDLSTSKSREPSRETFVVGDDIDLEDQEGREAAERAWRRRMRSMPHRERARQVALYLLIWGEASNLRFIPELICFIFKLADDHYLTRIASGSTESEVIEDGTFLRKVVKPIYTFLRDQSYKVIAGELVKKEKDHTVTIGYDDCNELFWSRNGIKRIRLKDGKTQLINLPIGEQYSALGEVDWKRAFHKTFKERRTALHLVVNFSRVWIIHLTAFYAFMAYTTAPIYSSENDYSFRWTLVGLMGSIATLFTLFAACCELAFIPSSLKNSKILGRRIFYLFLLLILNIAPAVYTLLVNSRNIISIILTIVTMIIGIITTICLIIIPPHDLFVRKANRGRNVSVAGNRTFTANYAPLKTTERALSIGIWVLVFFCKLLESLFFLILPVARPFKILASINTAKACGAGGAMLCSVMSYGSIALSVVWLLVLFFLDTYMWWIIWSTVLGSIRALYVGLSILTPWRNVFSRLPERMGTKLFATTSMPVRVKPKIMCAQVWNAIVVSMYEEHLISLEQMDKLLYHQYESEGEGGEVKQSIGRPKFFTAQEDVAASHKMEFFPRGGEAERRMNYFAQSMSMVFPEPTSVQKMPAFTVLTPHYGERILLPLREIIREHDATSSVTLLEYLKSLHPYEWENFVKDTKIYDQETSPKSGKESAFDDPFEDSEWNTQRLEDIPIYAVGFKNATPDAVLRTRIWASLRSQTLYRTISGFMNYPKALRVLYRVENPDLTERFADDEAGLEKFLDKMIRSKFTFVVAMQRFTQFNKEELADVEFLLKVYPDLQIAYIEEIPIEGDEKEVYSVLIDGRCEVLPDGKRIPKYRILLPGPPILGDGKADNQNHSLIFTRGEYLQLVDANQDNYFEEALKLRSVFSEFEPSSSSSYSRPPPVAIVGSREFIFSEKVGVLGDVAAGKEYTFGTIAQRVSAKLGARLHYGHPDFLNAIFMNTRGGVSKGQKGLHVNEDIFAGMNALQRGGRIKHTEYIQCGKGRDLGFASILKFVAKTGGGMGEQMLSREQYYLGTQLPLDRMFTFYYAHPGFHMNNIFIMFSIQLFVMLMLVFSSLMLTVTSCNAHDPDSKAPLLPAGCVDMLIVIDWVKQAVFAIVIVFGITFLPLFLQVLTESGILAAVTRIAKHIASLSFLFDVFTTQMYTHTLLHNLNYGGAAYIGTGRNFATSRQPFSTLFSAFAEQSIYFGIRMFVIMILISTVIPLPHLAFFWIMVLPLCVAPFLFNPHQFRLKEFILDYRNTLKWFGAGNGSSSSSESWIAFNRKLRVKITGHKRSSGSANKGLSRARKSVIFIQEILVPIILAVLAIIAYAAVFKKTSAIIRIAAIGLAPVALNAGMLLILFPISLLFGPIVGFVDKGGFGSFMAGLAHGWAVISLFISFMGCYVLGDWNFSKALLGVITVMFIQRAFFRLFTAVVLTREYDHDSSNKAWWSGRWYGSDLGWAAFTQPLREFFCKIIEMSSFASDFALVHIILFLLFPFCFIPWVDRWHTVMLLWTTPKETSIKFGDKIVKNEKVLSSKQKKSQSRAISCYGTLFVALLLFFLCVLIVPLAIKLPISSKSIPL